MQEASTNTGPAQKPIVTKYVPVHQILFGRPFAGTLHGGRLSRMGNGNGSPAARRQIGLLLRQLREEAGKSIQDVAESKIAGDTKMWRIESGRTLPSVPDVLGLCRVYRCDPATTNRMADMVEEVGRTSGGWWEQYGDQVPSWLSLYVGMEQTAVDIQVFEDGLVHGLCQTREYAIAANNDPKKAEHNADLRMARQRAVYDRDDDYGMRVVLGAGALTRTIGGPDVMAGQLQHLRSLTQKPHLEIRILGWDIGMHAATAGPFARFEFSSPQEDPVVYVPLLAGGQYFEKPEQIRPYTDAFGSIWPQATPVEEYTP
jgi:hypothetical protein